MNNFTLPDATVTISPKQFKELHEVGMSYFFKRISSDEYIELCRAICPELEKWINNVLVVDWEREH